MTVGWPWLAFSAVQTVRREIQRLTPSKGDTGTVRGATDAYTDSEVS